MGTFVANCKNLRPVQIKEIKETLGALEKSVRAIHQALLFAEAQPGDDAGGDVSTRAKPGKETGIGARPGLASAAANDAAQSEEVKG